MCVVAASGVLLVRLDGHEPGNLRAAEEGRQGEDEGPRVVEGADVALAVVLLVGLAGDEGHAEGGEDDQHHGADVDVGVGGPEGEVHDCTEGGCHVGDHDGDRTGRVDGEQVEAVDDQKEHDDQDAQRVDGELLGVDAEDEFHGVLP